MHNRQHRILLIAKRDYLATIRTKAFIIGLVVAPLLFGGGFLGVALMQSKPDIKERRIAIIDGSGVVGAAVIQAAQERNAKDLFDKTTHRQVQPHYVFETLPPAADPKAERLALSERVRQERLYAFIEIAPTVLSAPPATNDTGNAKDSKPGPVATYTNAGGFDEASGWLSGSINDGIRRVRQPGSAWTRAASPASLPASKWTGSAWFRATRKRARFARPARKTKSPSLACRSASCSCWA